MRIIHFLLIFLPLSLLAEWQGWGDTVIFFTAALAIIPLAGLMGEATESIAAKTGPQIGGLLNASLGNAAELIITIVAIRAGALELVKASIIGSILGNLLFVLGASLLLGGLRHGVQRFNRERVSLDATLVVLAAILITVPSFFSALIEPDARRVELLSLTTAAVILGMYVLAIIYTIWGYKDAGPGHGGGVLEATGIEAEVAEETGVHWSQRRALITMALAVVGLALMSEMLVGALEGVTHALGLTEFFVGIIVVPIIGNVAEHLVAVQVAMKNRMDLSLSIAFGSSLQIALFVAPVLVFVSLLMGNPMALEFNTPEMVAMIAASLIAALVAIDGRSNWLEGAMLIAVYGILALAFYFLPMTV